MTALKDPVVRTSLFIAAIALSGTPLRAQDLARAEEGEDTAKLYKEGEQAYQNGAYAKAIGFFTQVLDHDPEHLNAYLQRGFCFTLQREYIRAINDFSAVIQRKNDHTWAYISRGSAYAKLNKHDLAMKDFDRVLEIDPKNEEAYNNRGWSKKAQGDTKGACQDWKTSHKMGNAEARIIMTNNHCK